MSNKVNLTEESINDIIESYRLNNIGIETICKKYNVGKLKIKTILVNNGVQIKSRGGQVIDNSTKKINNTNVIQYESNNNSVVVCKKTGVIFSDVNNLSGVLTEHIKKLYSDAPIPKNTYQRKKYELKHGKKWYEEYFDIKECEKESQKVKKCPYCDWQTIDIDNNSGAFQSHLLNVHNINVDDYLKTYKEDETYFKKHINIKSRVLFLEKETNYVVCQLCGEKLKSINNSHLKKHNVTVLDYKEMFKTNKLNSKTTKNKLISLLRTNNINMKPKWTSSGELEVKDFIESLGFIVDKSRNRKILNGKELDLVIESNKLCIEYNGLYYHTEKMGKHYNYHKNKTIDTNEAGYSLIQIFEDEWKNKCGIVKLKLKHILNVSNGVKIGARKCVLKIIKPNDKSLFLNKYHIQGDDKSNIHIGAFFNNVLVGVMTFNNKRNMTKNNDGEVELSRYCTNYDFIISGLASKMVKFYIKNYKPKSIISFADIRWTINKYDNMYTKIGFKLVGELKPNYWYFFKKDHSIKRLHKFGFGKTALKKKHSNLDFTKTENELMTELGYDRIWDCGLFKYKLSIN
jgi:hypothetical protein